MTPAVTVAMCLYNSSRYIDDTIASLLAQTWTDFEAILLDDGSTDGCAAQIATRFSDRRLTLIRQPHRGLGVARAAAVSHARGKYVALLDHDDIWLPSKLERQIAAAEACPDAAIVFCDCQFIDAEGRASGAMSDRYDYSMIDFSAGTAHDELLARGCFIPLSTAFMPTALLRKLGVPRHDYRYVADYDMFLRLSRAHRIVYLKEPLARWRIYESQYTKRHPELVGGEPALLWRPIIRNHTYPAALRAIVSENLFGQRRCAIRQLLQQGRMRAALAIAASALREPRAILRQYGGRIRRARPRHVVSLPMRMGRFVRSFFPRARPETVGERVGAIGNSLTHGRLHQWLERGEPGPHDRRIVSTRDADVRHVWIDGTPLATMRTGYFNLTVEIIRSFINDDARWIVHVPAPPQGRSALRERLGTDVSRVRFHGAGWTPRRPGRRDTTEILIWRGRFRFSRSRKIAIVQDVTTRIHPELHPPANVAEFDEFARYVQRHAEMIATVSEHSRHDIIEHLPVRPASVRVFSMPVHPDYVRPRFSPAFPAAHGLTTPYLLCVGTIEPRKNLRRLVNAFELIQDDDALRDHVLALAGPPGWDDTFEKFLIDSDAYRRVRRLGFVPAEHLASLYHFASAVIYPSVYEGFGLPVLEALCSSAVVLTSNVTSLAELAGETVLIFDPFNTESIASAILGAVSMSPGERDAYRERCRARAESLLSESPQRPSLTTLLSSRVGEEQCASRLFSHSSI